MTLLVPSSRRYRSQTAQLGPFWTAFALYRHDRWDDELREAEWGRLGLSDSTRRLLYRAGFTCYRLVPACPDWLLRTVPQLGPLRLAEIRRILPYARNVWDGPRCPGQRLEEARAVAPATHPGLDAYLAEQARRELCGEPELIWTEASMASCERPEPAR
jgi:hypothetical protein